MVVAAQQQVTVDWWERRDDHDLYISDFVVSEASRGDPAAAARRLAALGGIPKLTTTEEAEQLAEVLLTGGGLPASAQVDALHVAVATVHGMECLLTWNCKHIANAARRGTIEGIARQRGFEPPVICTPFELPREEP